MVSPEVNPMNVSLNDSFRMLPRLVPALVCLAMLGAGCGQQKVPPRQQEADRQALAADSLHMARLYADWRQRVRSQGQQRHGEYVQMPLDLSEDAQYRFVKNRLQAAGSTPDNSPRLFHKLEKLRKEKKAGIPGKKSREDALTSTNAEESEGNSRCGHLLPLTDVESSDSTVAKFQATGLVTCFNGSDYTYADVTAFATNPEHTRFRVLGTQSLEEYAGAVIETPPLDLGLTVDSGEMLFVDSVAMAFSETTGESHLSYTVAESSVVALGTQDLNIISFQHPRELIGKQFPDNPIRTCLER